MNNRFPKLFNSFSLKMICLLFLIVGRGMFEYGNILNQPDKISPLYIIGHFLYAMAIPIAGFLIVEGCIKTKKPAMFIIRMTVAAALTQLLFIFLKYGTGLLNAPVLEDIQNMYFSLLLGLAAVTIMEHVIKKNLKENSFWYNFLGILTILAAVSLAVLLKTEMGPNIILTISCIYLFYDSPLVMLVCMAVIQIVTFGYGWIMYAPLLGTIFIWFYNGKEGPKNILTRIFTYAAYPAAFTIITLAIRALEERGGN